MNESDDSWRVVVELSKGRREGEGTALRVKGAHHPPSLPFYHQRQPNLVFCSQTRREVAKKRKFAQAKNEKKKEPGTEKGID